RRWPTVCARRADRAAHGAEAGCAYWRRIWRLEKGRRPGGGGRVCFLTGKKLADIRQPIPPDQKVSLVVFSSFPQFCVGGGRVMALTLIIGNKNYSSWSFRPWVALKVAGIAFE